MNLGIQYKAVMQYLVPVQMRGVRMVDWLGAMLAPLQWLNGVLVGWAGRVRYDLSFTGQVGNLEHVLNDQYDAAARLIYIIDPASQVVFKPYLFNLVELQPTSLVYNLGETMPTITLQNFSELSGGVDFIIKIPVGLNVPSTLIKMRALVNKYRQAGRIFNFETI
jgi:hypothetical protein